MLQNIAKAFAEGSLAEKKRLFSSILHEKLVFEKIRYRTVAPNPVLALIASNGADFGMYEHEKGRNISDLSTQVPSGKVEPNDAD